MHLDLRFFFDHPYAAASYDRDTRTLYLPLASLYEPWPAVPETNHEWVHARLHHAARAGNVIASALQTTVIGTEYNPGGLYADEMAAYLCTVVHVLEHGGPPLGSLSIDDGLSFVAEYAGSVGKELAALRTGTPLVLTARAQVPGFSLGSFDGYDRWVGGRSREESVAALERAVTDAQTAAVLLRADHAATEKVRRFPLLQEAWCPR